MNKNLETVTCEQLMTAPLKPIEYRVGRLLSVGLFILAGVSKIGKSWLSLAICLSVVRGECALGMKQFKELHFIYA